ncbi:MAG TPA: FMN-binding protein [Candidatus Saccharimonadales bacterium]|nr:FMN-binding protein [Candidatus Saccharimonadales bacterium]
MQQETYETPHRSPLIAGIIAIAILVVLIGGVIALQKKDSKASAAGSASTKESAVSDQANTEDDTESGQPSNNTAVQGTSSGTFKNGTFSANSSYNTPGGTEGIAVTITLNGGTISDVSISLHANNRESVEYQDRFASHYKSFVVGKNIGDVQLSGVSGSSLTSRGFNDALAQIEQQAAQV